MDKKIVAIIGAGPAGLAAAYELSQNDAYKVVIFEADDEVGGLSKTIRAKGFMFDIGPHRFYSKSERVNRFWEELLPLQGKSSVYDDKLDRKVELSPKEGAPDPAKTDKVMLSINRLTRILFLGKLFSYPISLNVDTVANLGFVRIVKIFWSYLKVKLFPIKDEKSLGEFYINRFGEELYNTFFKEYTEKVWGIDPLNISKEWGAQRVKGVSIRKVLMNAVGIGKSKETSLIERFKYPKLGAGQIYEVLAENLSKRGVEIRLGKQVVAIGANGGKVSSLEVLDSATNEREVFRADYLISSMPVKDLVKSLGPSVPQGVNALADGLLYRDMVVVGILLSKMNPVAGGKDEALGNTIPDNWLYVQEPGLKVGRLSIGNNFSPFTLKNDSEVSLYAEYFCNEGDEIWNKSDEEIGSYAVAELASIGLIGEEHVLEKKAVRVKKTYPAYFGTYGDFGQIREYLDGIENLFLVGRNGMHKYNNMDHSILTGFEAAKNIMEGVISKENVWRINTEEEYIESGKKTV